MTHTRRIQMVRRRRRQFRQPNPLIHMTRTHPRRTLVMARWFSLPQTLLLIRMTRMRLFKLPPARPRHRHSWNPQVICTTFTRPRRRQVLVTRWLPLIRTLRTRRLRPLRGGLLQLPNTMCRISHLLIHHTLPLPRLNHLPSPRQRPPKHLWSGLKL